MSTQTTLPAAPSPVADLRLPPGPKPRFPGDFELRSNRDLLGFMLETAREYGDIVHFRAGGQSIILLNDPDMIRDVLITSHRNFLKSLALERAKRVFGEGLLTSKGTFHRRQRRLMQPAFHPRRVAVYADVMSKHAKNLSESWSDGDARDMHHEMMVLTLHVVSETLFNTKVAAEALSIGEAIDSMQPIFRRAFWPFVKLIDRLPIPSNIQFQKALDRLDELIYRIIAEHHESGEDQGDLISMLLMAQDEDDNEHMTDVQVRDEAMTIFLAGHETLASALTYVWYLLATNPEAEAKLHEELDRVLQGRLPVSSDYSNLPYTKKVFAETMRMYPPAYAISRRAIKDHPLKNGYYAPAGSVVAMSQWVTHHDERWFPDPWRFDPERWTHEAEAERPKHSYFPFSTGPRICIGEGFAWMEGVLLIAALAQKWRFHVEPDFQLELRPFITLRPKDLPVTLEKRNAPVG